jgi:hypothetical protein
MQISNKKKTKNVFHTLECVTVYIFILFKRCTKCCLATFHQLFQKVSEQLKYLQNLYYIFNNKI